ncbi:hypothetical protein [Actinophytocola sp.]
MAMLVMVGLAEAAFRYRHLAALIATAVAGVGAALLVPSRSRWSPS